MLEYFNSSCSRISRREKSHYTHILYLRQKENIIIISLRVNDVILRLIFSPHTCCEYFCCMISTTWYFQVISINAEVTKSKGLLYTR